jgi:hypothetical protein
MDTFKSNVLCPITDTVDNYRVRKNKLTDLIAGKLYMDRHGRLYRVNS